MAAGDRKAGLALPMLLSVLLSIARVRGGRRSARVSWPGRPARPLLACRREVGLGGAAGCSGTRSGTIVGPRRRLAVPALAARSPPGLARGVVAERVRR